ncbi:electron transfer flavoprotein subunit alpha/FixB family protein [Peptidiphaga sp.]|uniref:electron transfer flavoprotein subunit alpha/FixB family protein n=1 Tax=Peptidiphaga sp. TaxID=2848648 RepID=UPI000F184015|nr:MAG: electron transfer flavoprotein subunit alpha/FixB family protein [Actinomyces sp.]
MANTWIIAVEPEIAALVEHGRAVGGSVVAVTVGGTPVAGVDRVVDVPLAEGVPAEAAAPAVAAAVAAEAGDVVLAANKPAERVLAGAVAARLGAPYLHGLKKIGQGSAELSRFGGIALETVSFDTAVVAVLDGGAVPEGEAPAAEAASGEYYEATVTGQDKVDVSSANLGSAKRIVAAGRGFKAEEDLKLAEDLAAAIGAELACSRPLAEGADWMSADRYIGVSGQSVAPDLYIAVGISGQIQHTVGMVDSKVVVAVNNDDKAPIFEGADYGIVADLYEALPAIVEAAK